MKRLIVALLVGGALFATVLGVAAAMNVSGGNVGAGTGSVTACSDAHVQYAPDPANTTQVKYVKVVMEEGVAPNNECAGATADVTLKPSGVTASGGITGGHGNDGETGWLTLSSTCSAYNLIGVDVVVYGP